MACGARSGLKPRVALQWHLWEERRREAHPEAQKRKRLLQVCLQSRGRLLEGCNRQGLGRAKVHIVGVTAHGAMSAPGGSGQALDLTVSRETTVFAHETKGRAGREVGKP